jgi:riboflavin kinase/FMN adenylyltransferase
VTFPAQLSGLDAAAGLPARPLHLAIGMFDGVHLGHRAVVAAAVQSARAGGGLAAALTFHPHPSALFTPGKPTRLILDPSAKAALLQSLGVDVVVTQPFTPEFAAIEAGAFLPFLKKALPGLMEIYVGEDWRFGAGRRGDLPLLVSEARKLGVSVYSAPPVSLDGEPVSSTRIRGLLEAGRIGEANALLGSPYSARGVVEGGKGLGRAIAFPTLNLAWSPDLRPRFGVYAVNVAGNRPPGSAHGVANYGVRPTVETTTQPLLEAHVLGPCGLGRGDEITVEWLQFLRPEMRFPGVDELRAQIARDVKQARGFFGID